MIPGRAARRPLALCLLLGACAVEGGTSLVPQPIDIHSGLGAPGPSAALAAPADWTPRPDIPTPRFEVPADRLFAALRQVAGGQPRTFLQVAYPDRLQAFYIVRSAALNLPDLVLVQALAAGPRASTLVMFSHSRYGPTEAGANERRLARWLREVRARLPDQ